MKAALKAYQAGLFGGGGSVPSVVYTFTYNGTNGLDGSSQSQLLPAGTFKIECWGAEGGVGTNGATECSPGGLGGYATGEVSLAAPTTVYVFVGGFPVSTVDPRGGWNGGGWVINRFDRVGGGGGGGSDVRIGGTGYDDRVVVGGGGGGGAAEPGVFNSNGGYGGGLVGERGYYRGDQTGGGPGGQDTGFSFGHGQGIPPSYPDFARGAGGGGWFGGHTSNAQYGGGGSSYIGGVVSIPEGNFPVVAVANGSTTGGVRSGHGQVVITGPL